MPSALKQQITDDMKSAMKAQDKERLGTIRLILAAIKQREVDERVELDDTEILITLDKMLKQRRDSIQQFVTAAREDLAEIERREITVIQHYLPEPLSTEEVSQLIAQAVSETEASTMADMGKIMNWLKPKLQGRADIAQVSKLVKEHLA